MGQNLSLSVWKPESGWERGVEAATQRELQLRCSPRAPGTDGFDPAEPRRGLVSKVPHATEGGRDVWA